MHRKVFQSDLDKSICENKKKISFEYNLKTKNTVEVSLRYHLVGSQSYDLFKLKEYSILLINYFYYLFITYLFIIYFLFFYYINILWCLFSYLQYL